MTTPKIEKVKAGIDKTKAKILEFQAKLRALERQKTELENEQIVALVRSEKISDAELDVLMKSLRREESDAVPIPAIAPVSGKSTRMEETHNANFDEN
jgi:hypothetical protein